MDLPSLYSQAVAAYDKAKPYCIAQVQYDEEDEYGETARLVVWRRYSTKRRANSDPDLRTIKNYAGGLFLLHMSEFEEAAKRYVQDAAGFFMHNKNTKCP